jgi:hypothetical protein
MPDVERLEESSKTNAILLLSKRRKEIEGGWRMDVDITVQDELDDENDAEDMIMSENEDKRGSEINSKLSTPYNICLSLLMTILTCLVYNMMTALMA